MGQQDALLQSSGARAVLQERDVLQIHRRRRRVGVHLESLFGKDDLDFRAMRPHVRRIFKVGHHGLHADAREECSVLRPVTRRVLLGGGEG